MLSIAQIKQSSSDASKYYMKEEKNYYMSEKGIANAKEWTGKLAESFGIAGKEVDQSTLEKMMNGVSPDGTEEVQKSNREGHHRTGWDLTLSAPKAASIMALVYGDTRFVEAHDKAVEMTAKEIERNCAQVRIKTEEGQLFQNTDNMAIAKVRHAVSREGDPQMHTHLLAMNMSRAEDGSLKAMSSTMVQKNGVINGMSERVYHDQKYYSAFYNSHYASILKEEGIEVESVGNGQFDIKGMDEDLKTGFSKRREEIKSKAEELGIKTSAGMDAVTLGTRKAKSNLSIDERSELWRKEAQALSPNFNGKLDIKTTGPTKEIEQSTKIALEQAMEHLGTIQTHFRQEKLLETAVSAFSIKEGVTISDMKTCLNKMIQDGEVITHENGRISPLKAIENEKEMISRSSHQSKDLKLSVNHTSMDKLNITPHNKKSVVKSLENNKMTSVLNIKGDRIPAIESLIVGAESAGRSIELVAPNRSYLKDLTGLKIDGSHAPTSTFRWFGESMPKNKMHTVHQSKGRNVSFQNKVVIVDQAQRLSFDDMKSLMDKAKNEDAKVILINQENTSKQKLNGHVVDAIKKGSVSNENFAYQKMTKTKVNMHETKDNFQRHSDIAKIYASLDEKQLSESNFMASTHKDVKDLTKHIRHELKNEGKLSRVEQEYQILTPIFMTKAQTKVAQSFSKGMIVEYSSEGKKAMYQITDIDSKTNKLEMLGSEGQGLRLKPSKLDSIRAFKMDRIKLGAEDKIQGYHKTQGDLSGTIHAISKDQLSILNEDGELKTLSKNDLKASTIDYAYTNKLGEHTQAKKNTFVSMPSYMANKESLGDLMNQSKDNLSIYTEHQDKLYKGFNESKLRASSISHVLNQKDTDLTKFTDSHHLKDLEKDINVAMSDLLNKHNETENMTRDKIIDKAVNFAIADISEREASFRHQDVVKDAMYQSFQEYNVPLKPEEIVAKLDQLKEKGTVLSARYGDGARYTTKETYETEKEILSQVTLGKDKVTPLVDEKNIDAVWDNTKLSKGQKEGVSLILSTKDRFVGIQGLAGVGKSTMLDQAQQISKMEQALNTNNQQIKFMGLAPTHQAVDELQAKGIQSQTSQRLLTDVFKASSKEIKEKYQNTIFLLDESSMVTNKDMLKFFEFVNDNNLRAVPIGDIKQIKGIGQGKPFEILQQTKSMDMAFINEIQRQAVLKDEQGNVIKGDEHLLKAVQSISQGDIQSSMNHLDKQESMGRIRYKEDRSIYQKVVKVKDVDNHLKKNVVSTEIKHEDPKIAKELAYQNMIKGASYDYLSRTPESRDQTLLIAYSHKTRDELTSYIREGLTKDGTLNNETSLTRLRSINISDNQKKNISSYENHPIVSIAGKSYYSVDHIDKDNSLVSLKDMNTNEIKVIQPEKTDTSKLALFDKKEVGISQNDKIMMRSTNQDIGYKTNESFTVKAIKDQTLVLVNDQKTIELNTNNIAQTHWDHAYAKTANSVQGATAKFAIGVDDPNSPLANMTRLYVNNSRATDHYRIYTTNTNQLKAKMLNNDGDKTSSLETLREIITDKNLKEKTMDTILFNKDKPKTFSKDNMKTNQNPVKTNFKTIEKTYKSLDKADVNQALNNNIENVLYSLLGEKNTTHSNSQTWSYGSNKGSLQVTMTGPHKGQWRDWAGTNSDHGNLISLIMRERGLEFKDSLDYASTLVSVDKKDITVQELVESKPKAQSTPKTFKQAQNYSTHSIPIKGTIAEKYLVEHRGITDTHDLKNIRFNPSVYSSEDRKSHPALIAEIKDKNGELKGIEAIYLDEKTNGKADLNIVKRSFGSKASHAIEVQGNANQSNVSYLAEGVETTLSIKESVDHESHVLAVSGKQNFTNIDPELLADKVILCLDNDGIAPQNDPVVDRTIRYLEEHGKEVYTTMPNDIKTDFNDLLKAEGHEAIRDKICQDIANNFNLKDENIIAEIADKVKDNKSNFDAGSYIEEMKKAVSEVMSSQFEINNHDIKNSLYDDYKESINKDNDLNKIISNDHSKNNLIDYELSL